MDKQIAEMENMLDQMKATREAHAAQMFRDTLNKGLALTDPMARENFFTHFMPKFMGQLGIYNNIAPALMDETFKRPDLFQDVMDKLDAVERGEGSMEALLENLYVA